MLDVECGMLNVGCVGSEMGDKEMGDKEMGDKEMGDKEMNLLTNLY